MATGVSKLEETNATVAGLKEELKEMQPKLEAKQKEVAELLVTVAGEKEE